MAKVTLVNDDGSTTDFFDQAHVDAAVQEAVAGVQPVVAPEATEIDLLLTDGSTKKFVPAA
jgi:adenine deaminase